MPLPKLSPLQSRLAASLIASIMLLLLYFTFASPHFAYAADVNSIRPEDHNHERLIGPILEVNLEELGLREAEGTAYEADFIGFDRGIVGRAATSTDPQALENNLPITDNIVQGQTKSYSFLKASVYGSPSPATSGLPSAINRRQLISGRREGDVEVLGALENVELDAEVLKLIRRQSTTDPRTVFISVNVCSQPSPVLNSTVEPPPQLQLYVSQSANNTNPGPGKDSTTQTMQLLEGGAAMLSINATGDVFIGLYGENTTAYSDVWSAQIAASIDGYFHTYNNHSDPNLFFVDSDSSSGLLLTGNLTNDDSNSDVYKAWMMASPPFVVFATDKNDRSIYGIQNSYCGMLHSSIGPTDQGKLPSKVQASITSRGNGQPRQQFYIDSLSSGITYSIALGIFGNSTNSGNNVVGGGGQVWPLTSFSTNTDGNCALILGLSFCDQTAYAVPGNPNTFPNMTSLAAFYDNNTQTQYQFFTNALAQIACETTSSAQYSLARTCDDCAAAYKEWLCSVSMPRCTDFSSPSTMWWLQERNMIQPFPNGTSLPTDLVNFANTTRYLSQSRNPNIDVTVQPGPYKEILPCDDLCYNIVQSCPAALNFGCPQPGNIAFNQSYGMMPDVAKYPEQNGQLTCNYPGATHLFSSRGSRTPSPMAKTFVTLAVMSLMFL